ncbi:hypothetical protein [Streptomyces noursei]|uniref:hypothetical protein n=1 Tax=Streptomyces noursei TaxID=1971 RepID=UPI000C9AF88A|nr:hypothetical protein [Streptomyces noursei]
MDTVTGTGSGEQALARTLYPRLQEGQLLLADRNFYSFTDWCQAADTGADLLWRVADTVQLPVLDTFGDGSYLSMVLDSALRGTAREHLLHTARAARHCRPGGPGMCGWSSTTCPTAARNRSANSSAC